MLHVKHMTEAKHVTFIICRSETLRESISIKKLAKKIE